MAIQPCHLIEKNGLQGWCESHGMYHSGRMASYATGTDEQSVRWREIWDNLSSGRVDGSVPVSEITPHITDYDDCPYRGKSLDSPACVCKTFSCSIHGVCTTQKAHRLKLCQECDDYPNGMVFLAGRDYEAGRPSQGKHGVVIGSYGMPGVVELSIAATRKACGDVPILIADDCTPESQGRKRLLDMPAKWPGVSLIMTGENLGHAPGDIRAFRNGIQWAQRHGIEYICKLSQRFIFTSKEWLKEVCDEMRIHGYAVSSQRAVHLHMQFMIRSECVFMDVKQCSESAALMARLDPAGGKIPTSAEDWLHAGINEAGLLPVHRCRKIPVDRFEKRTGILWHNTHGNDNYHSDGGEAYRDLAKELGVDLGPEFSASGWHAIAPNRPDAHYHML